MIKKIFQNHFNAVAFLSLAIIIFALYGKSVGFDFTHYDDDVLILDKQEYLKISNIKNIFFDTVFAQGQDKFCRPLLNISFLADKYLYGTNPRGYHFTNILVHVSAVFMIFLLLSLLKYDKTKTLLLCALFASHPALTQAVAWIPGRNDSLLTLFVASSFYFLVKYSGLRKNSYMFFHFFFFVCSLLTKETAVIVPLFYVSYAVFRKHTPGFIRMYSVYLLFIEVLYFAYRTFVLSYQDMPLIPTLKILANSFMSSFFPALAKYVANIITPLSLSVLRSSVETSAEIAFLLAVITILIFALLMISFRKYYDKKIVSFGFAWFFLFLIPTFLMPDNQFYDHRIYLPLAGIMIVLSEILKSYNIKKTGIMIYIALLAVFLPLLVLHENKFRDRQIFWVNALTDSPDSALANANVAMLLDEAGMYDEAEKKYLKAIELQNHSKHYVNLAVLYVHMNKIDKAEECLLKALNMSDSNPIIYYNLAAIYKYKGNNALAAEMKELYLKTFKDTNKYDKPSEIKI